MTDILDISQIHRTIDQKAKQIGVLNFETRNRIITILPRKSEVINAANGFLYPKSVPVGVDLVSIRGVFSLANPFVRDQQIEHAGNTTLTNKTSKIQIVELVEMVIRR